MKNSWWIWLGVLSSATAADRDGVCGTLAIELIEIERSDWTAWHSAPENSIRGPELREHVQQLLNQKKASMVETSMLAITPSHTATLKSVNEVIFPSEFGGGAKLGDEPGKTTHFSPSAFETQNTGFEITAEFTPSAEGDLHELKLKAEVVTRMENSVMGRGVNELVLPTFHRMGINGPYSREENKYDSLTSSIRLGESTFIQALTPHESVANRKEPTTLMFARVDLKTLQEPAEKADTKSPALAEAEPIGQVRYLVEWIEVPLKNIPQLQGVDDHRATVAKWIEAGEAKVIEANAFNATPGQRAKSEAVTEHLYASEFDPAEINEVGGILPAGPTALEMRRVGFTSEVEPQLNAQHGWADTRLSLEWVQFRGLRPYGNGLNEQTMPDFYTMRPTTSSRFGFGRSELITTHRFADEERQDSRLLVFVRVDVPSWKPPKQLKANKDQNDAALHPKPLGFWFEIIELEQRELNELIGQDNSKIRETALEVGSRVETTYANAMDAQRCEAVSVLELIYPSEYDPPDFTENGKFMTPNSPAAYETRQVGQSIEFNAAVNGFDWIEMKVVTEIVQRTGDLDFGKAESKSTMPIFHNQSINTTLEFESGSVALLGSTRPLASHNAKHKDPVWVWFVSGKILDIQPAPSK